MLFGAFPIVYQKVRGCSRAIGGCAFLGVLFGMLSAAVYMIIDNSRYNKVVKPSEDGRATPKDRLSPAMVHSVLIPNGMFWCAWTNCISIRKIVSIMASTPFGIGMVLLFISIFNYFVDSYTIYAASVLATKAFLGSVFGTPVQLFTIQMYHNLGIHWASSIPTFLALFCVSFRFIFYHYGARIRKVRNYCFIQHKC